MNLFPEVKRERRLIDMAPMVDLVFLLLIFFMVGSRFTEPALDLVLPEARSGAVQETRELVVTVARDGGVTLNGRPVAPDDLESALRDALKDAAERQVTLRADGRVSFEDFVRVMDEVRLAGGSALNIEHRSAGPRP
jgi:biopolymer transport protein ExbD